MVGGGYAYRADLHAPFVSSFLKAHAAPRCTGAGVEATRGGKSSSYAKPY